MGKKNVLFRFAVYTKRKMVDWGKKDEGKRKENRKKEGGWGGRMGEKVKRLKKDEKKKK